MFGRATIRLGIGPHSSLVFGARNVIMRVPHAARCCRLFFSSLTCVVSEINSERDGCIVWNAHNIVFGSKRQAICALAVYFLHSMRPSVT